MSECTLNIQKDSQKLNENREFKKEIKLSNMKHVTHKRRKEQQMKQTSMIEEDRSSVDNFSQKTVKIAKDRGDSPAFQQQPDHHDESFAPSTIKS